MAFLKMLLLLPFAVVMLTIGYFGVLLALPILLMLGFEKRSKL